MQVVGAIFEEQDANAILDVPIFSESIEVKYVWKFTCQGQYLVKSAIAYTCMCSPMLLAIRWS